MELKQPRLASPAEHYPRLLSPLRLGPIEVSHRAFMSAHGMGLGGTGPGISERYHEYLLARARGGAALLGIESAPVHHTTYSRSLVIRLDQDGSVPSLARLADAAHEAGAKVAITLWHGGHKDGALRGAYPVAPSAVPGMDGTVPHVLGVAEIEEIVQAYGAAAARCRAAGLDVLEVQTATDYLLGSFLSPALNHRDDAYGGSRERRLRILREVLEAVRKAAGDWIAVGVRCSARHDIPGASEDYTLEESLAVMSQLDRDGLVDYVSVMSGSGWAEGVSIPALHHPRALLSEEGRAFKRALRVPVTLAGRIRTAAEAEDLISSGAADAIAMARSWIADPDWGRKLLSGNERQIRPCMSCNQGCVGMVFRGVPGTCVLNPRAGREFEVADPGQSPHAPRLSAAGQPLRVVIIGGGPAGLEAARLAALQGFAVELHEADTELGGQWRLAGQAPGRHELLLSLAWWRSELLRLGVTVHLNSRIDVDQPPAADHIVYAIGALPAQTAVLRLRPHLRAGIPGSQSAAHSRDYLAGRVSVRGRVALIDEEHGWSSLSAVAQLLDDPKVVELTVVTTETNFGAAAVGPTFEAGALAAIHARGAARLRIYSSKSVQSIDNNKIILSDSVTLPGLDAVLLATGTAAQRIPDRALAAGDCLAPRGIWSATRDAERVVALLTN